MTHFIAILLAIVPACRSVVSPNSRSAANEPRPEVELQSAPGDSSWRERYARAQRETRPDLEKYSSAALTGALTSPESLWEFLVAPETPYPDRLAAALQGANVLPCEFLPRLMSARGELRAEERAHAFGLWPHPMSAAPRIAGVSASSKSASARTILGHKWPVPAQLSDYPLTWQEECAATWPWQVEQALDQLFNRLAYRARGDGGAGWHAAALTMPWGTDEEALRFVEATSAVLPHETLPVLSRWRSIALHAAMPESASRVAGELGEFQRLWNDARSGELAELLALDILRSSPHERARKEAAYSIASMGKTVLAERAGKDLRPWPGAAKLAPIADSLFLELGRMGLDAREGDEWSRLYAYVFSLCECLESPPIAVERRMDPSSAEVKRSLDTFAQWFRAREAGFEAGSAKEQPAWTQLRQLLESSGPR
jgi:hypothetical protein